MSHSNTNSKILSALKSLMGLTGADPVKRSKTTSLDELTDSDGELLNDIPDVPELSNIKRRKKRPLRKKQVEL